MLIVLPKGSVFLPKTIISNAVQAYQYEKNNYPEYAARSLTAFLRGVAGHYGPVCR